MAFDGNCGYFQHFTVKYSQYSKMYFSCHLTFKLLMAIKIELNVEYKIVAIILWTV